MRQIHTTPAPKILVMPASTRGESINRALAQRIADHAKPSADAEVVDLRDHPMPLYDGDLEVRDGIPATAVSLAARLAAADTLVVVSPEYNGTFSPLLKNTIDWVTRVDMGALAHLRVLVAAASPGRGGGATGADMLRTWLMHMGVDTAEHTLCIGAVPSADDAPTPDFADLDDVALDRFLEQAVRRRPAA